MKYIIVAIIALLTLTCCTNQHKVPETQVLCVKEGRHKFNPYEFSWDNESSFVFEWEFSDEMIYSHNNADQRDWNKLFGISAHLFTNHKNSVMVAWRWSLAGYWEVAPYYHLNGGTFYAEKDSDIPVLALWPGQKLQTYIEVSSDKKTVNVRIEAPIGVTDFSKTFDVKFDKVRVINPYFGGNLPATHDMCVVSRKVE